MGFTVFYNWKHARAKTKSLKRKLSHETPKAAPITETKLAKFYNHAIQSHTSPSSSVCYTFPPLGGTLSRSLAKSWVIKLITQPCLENTSNLSPYRIRDKAIRGCIARPEQVVTAATGPTGSAPSIVPALSGPVGRTSSGGIEPESSAV